MPSETAEHVPEVVVLRLPQYVRALGDLLRRGVTVVSSHQLGEHLQMTPAQIRKDLSYFGRFGKQGRGYPVNYLLDELRQVLGLERKWNSCLVGVGRLGRAIINYPGFTPEGFNIVAAFDSSPAEIGVSIGSLVIQPIAELEPTIRERDIRIGIVAVPASHAQEVIDQLVGFGVKAMLNYAPIGPQVPDGVRIRNVDPILALQSMTYYLKDN
ncbi:MAG: redox-sensing transcriptional repressor Rex [Chloroflexota bacterium]|nr:redox-sensing transcriptional repressor Rex [Chloroflexota bacterium]MDE2942044.1 redox-sensing transcriptional repressor Rex [Chloroflexota bacterium]MDE3267268.1 redox-sensing transcriptional repressor Rex [Chloroflexota bacterium]